MKPVIQTKLMNLTDHYEELGRLLSESSILSDVDQFKKLSKEYADLEPIITLYKQHQFLERELDEASLLLRDADQGMQAMAVIECAALDEQLSATQNALDLLLLPQDPDDNKNVYLEIRAGTGGHEAALFVGDLFRMYEKYAEKNRWHLAVVSAHEGEHGGYKEIILHVTGKKVYQQLKFESGAHRVQRVPKTEAQGRIHTSACTVAVMPEIDEVHSIVLNPADLRIDTYRASGAGGQHINKTDSAVRITHLPTGTMVECQEERSQHKNKAKAMALLSTRILNAQKSKQEQEQSQTRKLLVGTGDRSDRIRTYNFPQARVTDHRINLTLYKLDEILAGDLDVVIKPLQQEYQADLLKGLDE